VLTALGFGVYKNRTRTPRAVKVQVEAVARRDLTAIVTGSGKIRPFKEVDVSANVMGKIEELAVEEGQVVHAGEFLLRIDPIQYRTAVEQVEASIATAETNLQLAQENLHYARDVLDRREGLRKQDLISEEAYQEALQAVRREERTVAMRQQEIDRTRAQLKQSQHNLDQVSLSSPIDGVVTKLNVEEGENALVGTMNVAGTVLLTIADLSVVEAEIEIDETDIVNVEVGQDAEVRIDAFPDQVFKAQVTEVGKSPIAGLQQSANQAITFKVVVRLLEPVLGARPGLSCTADVITARRDQVLTVPIQSLILREVELDADGNIVNRDPVHDLVAEVSQDAEPSDSARQELEGAFIVRDGRAVFVPIKVGIAGERHFEILDGLAEGDDVVVGPFTVIRSLQTDERVEPEKAPRRRTTPAEETS